MSTTQSAGVSPDRPAVNQTSRPFEHPGRHARGERPAGRKRLLRLPETIDQNQGVRVVGSLQQEIVAPSGEKRGDFEVSGGDLPADRELEADFSADVASDDEIRAVRGPVGSRRR